MPKEKENNNQPLFSKVDDRIDSIILESRRIFLSDAIDSDSAELVIRKLWYLELTGPGKPILLVINSPGGSIDSGFAIWDQIKMMKSPVTTLVCGLAASMGSVLSLVASPKRRFATAQSRIMIHQPLIGGVVKGQATDLEIQAKEMIKTHEALIKLYVKHTGKDYKTIEKAMDRDTWMSAQEALEFGLLDKIVETMEEIGF